HRFSEQARRGVAAVIARFAGGVGGEGGLRETRFPFGGGFNASAALRAVRPAASPLFRASSARCGSRDRPLRGRRWRGGRIARDALSFWGRLQRLCRFAASDPGRLTAFPSKLGAVWQP